MKILDAKAALDREWKKLETISAWQLEKVKSKQQSDSGGRKRRKESPLATLIDMSHLKKEELEPKFQKYKDRVVLRGDIVKDAYAVFTEQGSSASQMTAAKVMDVIARLPDCDGQGADAVSPYTGKNGGYSQIAQNSNVRMY